MFDLDLGLGLQIFDLGLGLEARILVSSDLVKITV